jgi:hypothetical protein
LKRFPELDKELRSLGRAVLFAKAAGAEPGLTTIVIGGKAKCEMAKILGYGAGDPPDTETVRER